ncbi:MAG: AAA family ATPase [Bacteriovorax sp.]|nr:AAA family ATPase [Bacteriovorax sp.]
MKKKSNYLPKNLSFNDLNECLIFLGHDRQKNKADAQSKMEDVEAGLSDDEYEVLIDYINAMEMMEHNFKLKEIIPFCKREDLIKLAKKIYLIGYMGVADLDISSHLTQLEIAADFENLIDDINDKDIIDLLIEIDDEHDEIVLNEFIVPDDVLKSYVLHKIGIKTKKQSGDEINLSTNYNLDLLNMDSLCPHVHIEELKKVHQYLKRPGPKKFYNWVVLFEGAPGTGKTEYAKFCAKTMEQHFVYTSAGGLLSGFHGESEANIKKLFDEAARKNAIIFIDEADSLGSNRANASQSFETSIVNELLIQIEKYPGIVILSTNMTDNLDPALIDRSIQKITFNYLSKEQAQIAFNVFFERKLTASEREKLNNVKNLSLRNFRVVMQKTFFTEEADNLKLIKLLQLEVDFRTRIEDLGGK